MVGGNESRGRKPEGVVGEVGDCRVVWSATSLLNEVQHHLTFTLYFLVG